MRVFNEILMLLNGLRSSFVGGELFLIVKCLRGKLGKGIFNIFIFFVLLL